MPRVHGSEQPRDRERQERLHENAYRPSFVGSNRDSFLNSENEPNYTTVLSSDDPLDRIPWACSRTWSIQLQASLISQWNVDASGICSRVTGNSDKLL